MPEIKLDIGGTGGTPQPAPGPGLRGTVAAGLVVVAAMAGGFAAWSMLAPLESAAVAPGTVSLDSNRKTVQHLEGGIVREIAVREGEVVSAGQALIRLDETQIMARLEFLRAQLLADRRQLQLVAEEIATVRKLLAKGLTQKPRLLALQRREADDNNFGFGLFRLNWKFR